MQFHENCLVSMKKQDLINLVKYHVENNDEAFRMTVTEIAREFDRNGDYNTSSYLMELIASASFYVPQASYGNLKFLNKISYSSEPLLLPDVIEEDVMGIIKSVNNHMGLSKFLFYGKPGSGKTESAYQIARLLDKDILSVSYEQLIDSRLGETAKNISQLFDEINHLPYEHVLVLLDEIDSSVMDRVNSNDLREMGRVTSTFLKGLDSMNENVVLIATTNLISNFDKALIRRFDALISFDRYSKKDLIDIADSMLSTYLKKSANSKRDIRLFNKILSNIEDIPFPGDMKQLIKTSVAFSDESNEYDYLRKFYMSLHQSLDAMNIQKLKDSGYTTREIEILTRIPKSSVSRKLREK